MTSNDSITTPCTHLHKFFARDTAGELSVWSCMRCGHTESLIPEGTHMTTPHPGKRTPTPTIPEAVKELTIKRSDYDDDLHVWIKGSRWSMSITTTDDELLTRINEIAAAMEAVK